MVLECFFPIAVHGKSWPPRWGQLGPQGQGWQDLCRRPLDIALYQIYLYKLWA